MAVTDKPLCGCGHPFEDHPEIKDSKGGIQLVCMHVTPLKNGMATICGCGNYKTAMTLEQKFKNCVMEALVADVPAIWLTDGTAVRIVNAAWEKYNQ